MALTNAEKQKRWRERQKAIKAGMLDTAPKSEPLDTAFLLHGFNDWIASDPDRLQTYANCIAELAGLPPEELAGEKSGQDMLAVHYTISVCLQSAITLAGLVSDFKRGKLMERVQTMELSGLKEGKEEAMQQVAQLARMHDDYSRKSRAELQTFLLDSEAAACRALAQSLDQAN